MPPDATREPAEGHSIILGADPARGCARGPAADDERFRLCLEYVPAAVAMFDREMRCLAASRRWVIEHQLSDIDIVGRSAYELVPDTPERWRDVHRRCLEGGVAWSESDWVRRADGTMDWVWWEAAPWCDRQGDIGGLVIRSDIIRNRGPRDERAHLLAALVDSSNDASEFLSRMSHELRTPLNAVLGFAQLLEMDGLNGDQRESVAHILKAGRHLLELINEVLDIVRIDAGRLSVSLEPVSVSAAASEVLNLLAPIAASSGVDVRVDEASTVESYALADRQRIKQILLNLVDNAIKYNRQHGVVTVASEDAPGERVRIVVRDTGRGISPERMERLFTPFDRLGAEQTAVEGTGLGLSLAKRLAEAMGGTVGAESTAGTGSTFWVELGRAGIPSAVSAADRLETATGTGRQAPSEQHVVLYIEDSLSNYELIWHIFSRRPGVTLLSAMQGRLGLSLAQEHRPHLILLDLHLPDMTGEEVLQRLREHPGTSKIPVVVVSADATPARIDRMLELGAAGYLTKPLDIKKFLDTVNRILRR